MKFYKRPEIKGYQAIEYGVHAGYSSCASLNVFTTIPCLVLCLRSLMSTDSKTQDLATWLPVILASKSQSMETGR